METRNNSNSKGKQQIKPDNNHYIFIFISLAFHIIFLWHQTLFLADRLTVIYILFVLVLYINLSNVLPWHTGLILSIKNQ